MKKKYEELLFSCRIQLVILLFLTITTCYMIRVDLNTTLLSMVNETFLPNQINDTDLKLCTNDDESRVEDRVHKHFSTGTYLWDRPTQGYILGAFFWGYILTQIPGGILSLKFGPKWLGAICIGGSALLDLCLPFAASVDSRLLIALRIAQGSCQGMLMPIVGCLLGRWVPPNERTRATAFALAGCQVGTILGQVIAGLLAQVRQSINPDTGEVDRYYSNWTYAHCSFGSLGLFLVLLWWFVVYNRPEDHPRIRKKELIYLQNRLSMRSSPIRSNDLTVDAPVKANKNTGQERQLTTTGEMQIKSDAPQVVDSSGQSDSEQQTSSGLTYGFADVPWVQLLRSAPFWSIMICNVTANWCWYTLITCMPTYMSRVLGFSLTKNGLLSSLPYLAQCLFAQLVAALSDVVITRKWLTVTWVRKINNILSLGGLGCGMLAVGLIGCNRTGAVAILVVSIGILGAASSGFSTNSVDLAPNYAGIIISLTNTIATLPGIFGPLFVGYITKNSSTTDDWMIVFGVCAAIAWFGAVFNLFATSGVIQPWAFNKRT